MGRGKLKMEMIEEEKSRILTMKKRKKGLIKKLHQLTTLCDVPACMIFHDPTTNSTSVWLEEDPDQVRSLIEAYKAKKNDPSGGVREYLLSNFFDQRQRQAEEELEKLRKNNVEGMFPTWDDHLNFMDEAQLRELAATVRGKAENHNQQRRRERKHCGEGGGASSKAAMADREALIGARSQSRRNGAKAPWSSAITH
ncbi:MADS-box transcription factor 23-like [Salvia splendens]|nr:MADS-box transcription factor 23-like [Salvia splendens]